MNGDVDYVAPRPRPISGGLWTIFSWLRRDEHNSSSESLSSAGSDRTAASFAFHKPTNYSVGKTTNVLPALGPPTDSYRKRVHERNIRRENERDLTLHRKYGLYRSEGVTGYDTLTLQQYRRIDADSRSKWGRERRATSECLQRRSVHVPGKRRAPLPPTYPATLGGSVTFSRRARKRRAPQPPTNNTNQYTDGNKCKEVSSDMSSLNCGERSVVTSDSTVDCKLEKYVKKDTNHKETKNKSEKSFLRQIFENRKRNSNTDTASIKLLPSISELDKQAAEIIETGKLKVALQNRTIFGETIKHEQLEDLEIKKESWFCTKCLKKYDASIKECFYCYPKVNDGTAESVIKLLPYLKNEIYTQTDYGSEHPSSSKSHRFEDKQKLKEILKEMKDSLPKRIKHEKEHIVKNDSKYFQDITTRKKSIVLETPTLRIGSKDTIDGQYNEASSSNATKNNDQLTNQAMHTNTSNIEHVKTEHPVTSRDSMKSAVVVRAKNTELLIKLPHKKECKNMQTEKLNTNKYDNTTKMPIHSNANIDLHTPLRISALLNPMYIPKNKDNKPISKEIISMDSKPAKTNTTNKSAIVPTEMVSLVSSSSHIVHSGLLPKRNDSISQLKTALPEATKINDRLNNAKIIIKPEPGIPLKEDIPPSINVKMKLKPVNPDCKANKPPVIPSNIAVAASTSECNKSSITSANVERVNQHIRRRELVNQLEKSIAKGDESAAADAAVKLAQLRLSCSVLSFSSQIVTETASSPLDITEIKKYTNNGQNKEKTRAIKPLDSYETKNMSNNVEEHIVNIENTTEQTSKSLFNTNLKEVQGVKVEITNLATRKDCKKSEIVKKKKHPVVKIAPFTDNESVDNIKNTNSISIKVWVEDKEATRGPINLNTQRQAVMGELRLQAEAALGLPSRLQRWIVGRTLCTDDNVPVVSLAGPEFNAPFYLCLVEPGISDLNKASTSNVQIGDKCNTAKTISENNVTTIDSGIVKEEQQQTTKVINQNNVQAIVGNTVNVMMQNEDLAANVYNELVKLEQQAFLPNAEAFECGVCMDECKQDQGVVLRECVHSFCRNCLSGLVRHCEDPDIFCPAIGCRGMLQEREIRGLVSAEDYERWLARGLAAAESGTRNSFHCRTRDCTGWALCDPGVQKFPCPVCNSTNCIPCQAIHKDESCDDYRARLRSVSNIDSDQIDVSTRALIKTLISKGEALECPECKTVITKKWGCDWVKCSACKTEICWVTRGRRWGPAGRGDTSGGCRCGIEGKKCHPSCGYCH